MVLFWCRFSNVVVQFSFRGLNQMHSKFVIYATINQI